MFERARGSVSRDVKSQTKRRDFNDGRALVTLNDLLDRWHQRSGDLP